LFQTPMHYTSIPLDVLRGAAEEASTVSAWSSNRRRIGKRTMKIRIPSPSTGEAPCGRPDGVRAGAGS
jgi:hypothetical protein